MRLKVTQENLNKALSVVSRVASGRGTLPILSHILIKAEQGRVTLSSTNLEIAISTTLTGRVEEPGEATVPAKLMHDFVSSLPKDTIELSLEGQGLHISSQKYTSTINGMSADEFPSLPNISTDSAYELPVDLLKNAIQRVVFAASNDEARQVLTGVYMHTSDGSLYMAATDSYRLAEQRLLPNEDDIALLVPATTLQELMRIIGDDSLPVMLRYDEGQVMFEYGEVRLISRLINGNYPDYRQLIPGESETACTLSRQDFLNITKVSSLFAKESAGSITLHVSEEDQEVSIRSIASQVGENTSRAQAEVRGEGDVTLNSRYLIDALNAFSADTVTFRFSGKINPCVMTGRDKGGDDYIHIIMPLRA